MEALAVRMRTRYRLSEGSVSQIFVMLESGRMRTIVILFIEQIKS